MHISGRNGKKEKKRKAKKKEHNYNSLPTSFLLLLLPSSISLTFPLRSQRKLLHGTQRLPKCSCQFQPSNGS